MRGYAVDEQISFVVFCLATLSYQLSCTPEYSIVSSILQFTAFESPEALVSAIDTTLQFPTSFSTPALGPTRGKEKKKEPTDISFIYAR